MQVRTFCCLCVLSLGILLFSGGCKKQKEQARILPPRPVSVYRLKEVDPTRRYRVAGSVASWKTDQLGFEVSGRVEYIIEPEQDIEGRTYTIDGKVLNKGTLLARIDSERYELAVAEAKANIDAAKRQADAIKVEIEQVIPAQRRVAEARLKVAKAELGREKELFRKNASTQSQLDRAQGNYDSAVATVTQIQATQKAKRAELAALEAKIKQLECQLKDAERNLADCELRSWFRGQVAEVHVVPGSYVERGEPVVTVQMMDPIKVECEVAPAVTRQIDFRDNVPVFISLPDGKELRKDGFVYMIDPVADPKTRTFTVTILVRNEKVHVPVPPELKDKPIARTKQLWKVMRSPEHFHSDAWFVDAQTLHKDAKGYFVWRVLNRNAQSHSRTASPVLKVKKMRVKRGKRSVRFLGLWKLVEVVLDPKEKFDPQNELICGALEVPNGKPDEWNGDTVLFDPGYWLLRPGDVVGVNLRGETGEPGFYVPMNMIIESRERHYVVAVTESEQGLKAEWIEVEVADGPDTLKKIKSDKLKEGMRLIVDGVQYVQNGETVNVVEEKVPEVLQ